MGDREAWLRELREVQYARLEREAVTKPQPPVTKTVTKPVTRPVTVTKPVTPCLRCAELEAKVKHLEGWLQAERTKRIPRAEPVPVVERMRAYRRRLKAARQALGGGDGG